MYILIMLCFICCVRMWRHVLCVFYAMHCVRSYVSFLGGIKRKVLCYDLVGVVHYGS